MTGGERCSATCSGKLCRRLIRRGEATRTYVQIAEAMGNGLLFRRRSYEGRNPISIVCRAPRRHRKRRESHGYGGGLSTESDFCCELENSGAGARRRPLIRRSPEGKRASATYACSATSSGRFRAAHNTRDLHRTSSGTSTELHRESEVGSDRGTTSPCRRDPVLRQARAVSSRGARLPDSRRRE